MKKTEKMRYEVDPHNRLVYEETGRKSNIPRFRTVFEKKEQLELSPYVGRRPTLRD